MDRVRRRLLGALPVVSLGCLARTLAHAQSRLDVPAIEAAAAEADLHSVLVWQAGRLLVEHHRRSKDKPIGDLLTREVAFGPDVLHDMRSISKSVVSLLVGQAVGRGQVDPETPVLDFHPDLADLRSGGRDAIRVSHLLDMSSGLAWNESAGSYGTAANDETRLYRDGEPARYILDRPLVASPGTQWNYNGGLTVLLADLLERRTGRRLLELAADDLFGPLGIRRWEWRTGWHRRPLAYAGLRLTSPDLLRLGTLVLAGGASEGRQIVPADWIAGMLRPRITIGQGPLGYSRQWWSGTVPRADMRSVAWTAAFGNGGQRLFVLPELDLAVVFTAGAYNSETIGRTEFALLRRIVAMV